jgi:8-oxo-dGTP diphosphatase
MQQNNMNGKKADKIIRVGCGVIIENGALFAARRSSTSDQPMKWELPGGKLEAGESAAEAVVRELREELEIETELSSEKPGLDGYGGGSPGEGSPGEGLLSTVYRYPEKTIELIPVRVKIVSGLPRAVMHHEIAWIPLGKTEGIDWADADRALLEINNMLLDSNRDN